MDLISECNDTLVSECNDSLVSECNAASILECNDALLLDAVSEYLETRIKAYHSLTEKHSLENQQWGETFQEKDVKIMVANLNNDIFSDNKDFSFEATGFLGCFLANDILMDMLTEQEEQEILDALIRLLENVKEKYILTRGLWSLAQSKFACNIYKSNITKILKLLILILDDDPSNIIIYETLQVLKSVTESVPVETLQRASIWLPKTFGFLFHEDLKVRGVTYSCYNTCRGLNNSDIAMKKLKEEILPFSNDLKVIHCKKMVKYIEEECSFILKIWRLLIIILGRDLHSGTALINSFLEVVEKSFKSPKFEMRIDAFKCWHTLIGNFSTDINVLSHPKRLRLLIAPLKSNNAKTEEITFVKLVTWWYFICQLKEKASENFDTVVTPFFRFCFNPNTMSASGANERLFLLSATASPCRKYTSLHVKTAEALARILSFDVNHKSKYTFSINGLTHLLISPSLFLKNYQIIYGCVEDALTSLDSSDTKQYELGCLILQCVIYHTISVFQQPSGKKEYIDIIKDLFGTFSVIESHCETGDSCSLFALKFLELTCVGEFSLPQFVVTSRLYHIPTGTKVRDLMNGTLSNFFIHKLCRPILLHFATVDKDGFLELWESILIRSKSSDRLVFLETVIEEMKDTITFLCPDHENVLISLWNITAKFLDTHIEETQTINQGDSQEHDWSCIYNMLLFPIFFSHEHLSSVNSKGYESMIKMWLTLWKHFTLLTMLTKTAEPNCETEFIARKMLSLAADKLTVPPDDIGVTLSFFSDVVAIIIDQFRFKELGKKPKKSLQSPLKMKKKPHPLHALSGIVELVDLLMEKTIRMISAHRQHIMLRLCSSATKIFTNLPNDKMVWSLVTNFNETIHKALQINPTAKFNSEVERSFIDMWDSYCCLIETRVAPQLTKDQLTYLTPLLYVALQSSHMGIRKRTRHMWSSSFASTSHAIPDSLYELLKGLCLPPASISDLNEEESQSLGSKDIITICGSFLNWKDLPKSPFPSKSKKPSTPLKKSPTNSSEKLTTFKSLNIGDLSEKEFTKVRNLKPLRRALTPHQAEKMKKRACDIPALYNDASSQSSQLPSEFICYDTQESSMTSCSKNMVGDLSKRKSATSLDFLQCIKQPISKIFTSPSTCPQHVLEIERFIKTQKRKSATPLKKSLNDIRKSLKGKITEKQKSSKVGVSYSFSSTNMSTLEPDTVSPLASPLKGSQSPSKTIGRSFSSIRSSRNSEDVSEDEIPNSQKDCSSSITSLLLTPNSIERPKRKRKSKYDDSEMFIMTPLKKTKVSPRKTTLNDTIILDDSAHLTPSQTVLSTSPELKQNLSVSLPVGLSDMAKSDNNQEMSVMDESKSEISISSRSPKKLIVPVPKSPFKRELQTRYVTESPLKAELAKRVLSKPDKPDKCENILSKVADTNLKVNDSPSTKKATMLTSDSRNVSHSPLGTPSKLSRSGRRIVAPNKDMPQPMTPPGNKNNKDMPQPMTPPGNKNNKDMPQPMTPPGNKNKSESSLERKEKNIYSRDSKMGENQKLEDSSSDISSNQSLSMLRSTYIEPSESDSSQNLCQTRVKGRHSKYKGKPAVKGRLSLRSNTKAKFVLNKGEEEENFVSVSKKLKSIEKFSSMDNVSDKDNSLDNENKKTDNEIINYFCENVSQTYNSEGELCNKKHIKSKRKQVQKHLSSEHLNCQKSDLRALRRSRRSSKKVTTLLTDQSEKHSEVISFVTENLLKDSRSGEEIAKSKLKCCKATVDDHFQKHDSVADSNKIVTDNQFKIEKTLSVVQSPNKAVGSCNVNYLNNKLVILNSSDESDNASSSSILGNKLMRNKNELNSSPIKTVTDADNPLTSFSQICFKSGNLSLSPHKHMEPMKHVASVEFPKLPDVNTSPLAIDITLIKQNATTENNNDCPVKLTPDSPSKSTVLLKSMSPCKASLSFPHIISSPEKAFSQVVSSKSSESGCDIPNTKILIVKSKYNISSEKISSLAHKTSPAKNVTTPLKLVGYCYPLNKSEDSKFASKKLIFANNSDTASSDVDLITSEQELIITDNKTESFPKESDLILKEIDPIPKEPDLILKESDSIPKVSNSIPIEISSIPIESCLISKMGDSSTKIADTNVTDFIAIKTDSILKETESILTETDSIQIITNSVMKRIDSFNKDNDSVIKEADSLMEEADSIISQNESFIEETNSIVKETDSFIKKTDIIAENIDLIIKESVSMVEVTGNTNKEESSTNDTDSSSNETNYLNKMKDFANKESDPVTKHMDSFMKGEDSFVNVADLFTEKETSLNAKSCVKDTDLNLKEKDSNFMKESHSFTEEFSSIVQENESVSKCNSASIEKTEDFDAAVPATADLGTTLEIESSLRPNSTGSEMTESVDDDDEAITKEEICKSNSKLVNTVSTPELKKFSFKTSNSRAAMIVACAQRTMKTRNVDSIVEYPPEKGLVTPTSSPPHKKKKLEGFPDSKPWLKHEPSPGASPFGSILKRKGLGEEDSPTVSVTGITESGDSSSPSLLKNRRVSFADPVSESVEIPASPKVFKGIRAQKRLDMTNADLPKECGVASQDEELMGMMNCSQPLFSSLLHCKDSIELLTPMLTTPYLCESLMNILKGSGYHTVGDFCNISEAELSTFPVRSPKVSATKMCLKKYQETTLKRRLKKLKRSPLVHKLTKKRKLSVEATEEENFIDNCITRETVGERTQENYSKEPAMLETSPMEAEISEMESVNSIVESQNERTQRNKTSDFVSSFCSPLKKDPDSIVTFTRGLSDETRQNLLRVLINTIPRQDVLDVFFEYLKDKNSE